MSLQAPVVIVSGMKGSIKMHQYLLHRDRDRADDYYKTMGGLAVRALSEEAIIAARYIKNSQIKNDFRNNLALFIEHQQEVLNGASSPAQKLLALKNLNQEKAYLSDQVFKIKYKKYIAAVSIAVDKASESLDAPLFYIVKGVGFISGALQFFGGIGLIGGSYVTGPGAVIGNAAGVVLVLHGLGAVQENFMAVQTGQRNYKGYLRLFYHSTIESLGYTSKQADIVYGGIDLALSLYMLARPVLLPDKIRLFHYMYNDTIFGFQAMAKTNALRLELGIDGLTIKSVIDSTNPILHQIPIPFPSITGAAD